MVKLWAYKVNAGLCSIEDVPERYREQVKVELGITDKDYYVS